MDDKKSPEVTGSKQFGKTSQYREGESSKAKQVSYIAGPIILVAVVGALIRDSPEKDSSIQSPFSVPETNYQDQGIQFPDYSHLGDETTRNARSTYGTLSSGRPGVSAIFSGPKLISRPKLSEIPPGSQVKAVLLTGATNGVVRAKSTEALTLNGEVILPEGVLFLGTGQSTDEGLVVQFEKIVFQDGAYQTVQAKALDFDDKMPRLKGSKVGYYGWKLAASAGLNFAAGMADALQERETNGQVVMAKPTVKNALLNGSSRAALDLSQEELTNMKGKPQVFEIKSGTQIFVTFN